MNQTVSEPLSFGKRLLGNTVSNYLSMAIKLVSSVFITYLLFRGLGREYYGFWSLLWSVFMYSLLLDLGFGKAVEKYSAEASFSGNMSKFNTIISTIVFSYVVMALLIVAIGSTMSFYLDEIFHFETRDPQLLGHYQYVFVLFTIGIAVVFPTGIFPIILLGLQRGYLRNYVLIANKLVELAGIWYIIHSHYPLPVLVIFSASINLLSNVAMAIMAFHLMPGLRINFKYIRFSTLRYIADFSFFTYILTICDLIIFQTDRVVLGVMLGMASVGAYQVATKIPQIISIASTQFQSNLAPIAAILYKSGDKKKLQQTMLTSTRITVFICTGVFTIFIPIVRPIMFVWLKVDDREIINVAYILIVSTYTLIIFRDTAKHFLLMTGYHRLLTHIAMVESVSNLGLSILFVKLIGIEGVAWGTLIPNLLISFMVIFPIAARHSGNSPILYLLKVYVPVVLLAVPIILFVIFIRNSLLLDSWTPFTLIMLAPATGMLYLLIGWLIYVKHEEKEKLCSLLPKFIPEKLVAAIAK